VANDFERDPFKVGLLGASALSSPVMFWRFDWLSSGTLRSFPAPFGRLFLLWLFVSSVTALYGIVRQRTVRGVLWERAGMYGVGFLFLTYGVWAWVVFGGPATGFASLLIMVGVAAIVRIRQINRRRKDRRRRAVGRGPT
jgi:hypothetical protein